MAKKCTESNESFNKIPQTSGPAMRAGSASPEHVDSTSVAS